MNDFKYSECKKIIKSHRCVWIYFIIPISNLYCRHFTIFQPGDVRIRLRGVHGQVSSQAEMSMNRVVHRPSSWRAELSTVRVVHGLSCLWAKLSTGWVVPHSVLGVTSKQRMLTRKLHLILPLQLSGVRVSLHLILHLLFGLWLRFTQCWFCSFVSLSYTLEGDEGLSPSCIALSFDRFGSIPWHSIFFGSFIVFTILRISNFFGLSSTDETWLVEMCIWCIKICIVLILRFNPWVEASVGGLQVP
jgi:hypothetical protein